MAELNLAYGWVAGDQVRLLIASGLTVGSYQIDRITDDMNELGSYDVNAVTAVRGLMDEYEAAQVRFNTLNSTGDNRILVKADVLEWEQANGMMYNPQSEIKRIRGLLSQYFGFSVLFEQNSNGMGTHLYRS